MKIIRIDRFTGKEEVINNKHIETLFTVEQYEDLLKGIPQTTFSFTYQLDTEIKESDYGQ